MFTFDEAFEKDMMEQLDWKAVINIGMAPPGMQLPMNSKCGFKEEFAEAHYAAKEKKFLAKQSKETKEWVSIALAAKTHSRMIKTFSRIVPDAMTVNTAFAIWKDVDSYTKSINEDGGESYKLMNMNLVDLKLAVQASSIQKSTQKMNAAMALGSEFDMEGEKPEDQKKETSSEKRERLAKVSPSSLLLCPPISPVLTQVLFSLVLVFSAPSFCLSVSLFFSFSLRLSSFRRSWSRWRNKLSATTT